MDFLITYYKEIIALIGSITGLLGLAITIYSKYRDSNIKDKELELKQKQFELDKQHQISKETYQKIFEKKLLLYKQLSESLMKYNNRIHNIGIEITFGYKESEVITEDEVAVKSLKEILSLLEKNIFYLSDNLEEEYKKINDNYKKALYDFESDMQLGVYNHDEDYAEAELMQSNSEFYKKHKDDMKSLYSLIEKEIKVIKQDIGFI